MSAALPARRLIVSAQIVLVAAGLMAAQSAPAHRTALTRPAAATAPAVVVAAPVTRVVAVQPPAAAATIRRAAAPARRVTVRPRTARPVAAARRAATVRRTAHVVRRAAAAPLSPQQRMMQAVGRIPGSQAETAHWVLSSSYGHWGTADWYNNTVYVSPSVPSARMYDVVVHEWSHLLSVRDYAGNVDAATAAMNGWFGGSDLVGAERAADCMALQLGASWTHYTSCNDAHWRAGAARLVAGQQV